MDKIALDRLIIEKRDYKKQRQFGFYAKPSKNKDGTLNMFKWECGIPGPKDCPWEGGIYELTLEFPDDYPTAPPKAKFKDKLFHPNIYPSGAVCLSILNEEEDWRPCLKINNILTGIQNLLKHPNEKSPAQSEAYSVYVNDKSKYIEKIKEYAKQHSITNK